MKTGLIVKMCRGKSTDNGYRKLKLCRLLNITTSYVVKNSLNYKQEMACVVTVNNE